MASQPALIRFKKGVTAEYLYPVTLRGLADLADLWDSRLRGLPFVVTSLMDGTHCDEAQGRPCPDGKPRSRHYEGLAFDFRTKHAEPTHVELVVREFRAAHPGWQIFVEHFGRPTEHGHAEFDPPPDMSANPAIPVS